MSLHKLTDEHKLFQKTVRKWVEQQLTPYLYTMEEKHTSDPRLLVELQELGFLNAAISENLGGAGGDHLMNIVFLEELGRAGSIGFAQTVKQHAALALPFLSQFKVIQNRLVNEIEKKSIFTFVTQKETNSTTLPFVINGLNAHFVVVHRLEQHQLELYDLKDPKIRIHSNTSLLGWRTANIASIDLEHVQPVFTLELDSSLSEEITALEQVLDAAIISGVLQTTLNKTRQYAQERTQFNGPLTQFQVLRHKLVDLAIEVEKMKNYLYYVAFSYGQKSFLNLSPLLRLYTEQIAPIVTDSAQQIFGGNGYMMEFDIQRYWRDCQMYSVINSETFSSQESIGEQLLNSI